ncbi:MAG: hypothetical protein KGL68_10645 [Burkholderiales bacterium]|nr:hypothetical protein [Burkholderiales bacterium]
MSDFSELEQSFVMPALEDAVRFEPPPSDEVRPHEVGFRRLRGHREIEQVLHLRREIALPASALQDPDFASREKKETKSGWWVPSSASVRRSGPFG